MTTTGRIITEVLSNLGFIATFVDDDQVVLKINKPHSQKSHYVINNILGVNSESDTKLCADKSYTYNLLKRSVAMPFTKSYLDPSGSRYPEYLQFTSQEKVLEDIKKTFSLPIVVKKNTGSMGSGVYLCKSWDQVEKAVARIFNKESAGYDYICVVQDALKIEKEWRVIMYNGQLQFLYQKDTSNAIFTGNLSPLHWENSKAVLIADTLLNKKIQSFLDPVFTQWQLPYGGFDVVQDAKGKLWLIEINSHPAFTVFLRDNSSDSLRELYKKILTELLGKEET